MTKLLTKKYSDSVCVPLSTETNTSSAREDDVVQKIIIIKKYWCSGSWRLEGRFVSPLHTNIIMHIFTLPHTHKVRKF